MDILNGTTLVRLGKDGTPSMMKAQEALVIYIFFFEEYSSILLFFDLGSYCGRVRFNFTVG